MEAEQIGVWKIELRCNRVHTPSVEEHQRLVLAETLQEATALAIRLMCHPAYDDVRVWKVGTALTSTGVKAVEDTPGNSPEMAGGGDGPLRSMRDLSCDLATTGTATDPVLQVSLCARSMQEMWAM